jgi:hypothetical protein
MLISISRILINAIIGTAGSGVVKEMSRMRQFFANYRIGAISGLKPSTP